MFNMKRILLLLAAALLMTACGQKDAKNQENTEEKKVVVPPGMPVAPTQQVLPQAQNQGELNSPMLNMEEGQPIDLGQLMGNQKKSMGEQSAEQIDNIRY